RVVEHSLLLERPNHLLDEVVNPEERLGLSAVEAVDLPDLVGGQERALPDGRRLVGDARLVEVGGSRSGGARKRVLVAWRGARVVPLAIAGAGLDVRLVRGEVEEERLAARGAAADEPGRH